MNTIDIPLRRQPDQEWQEGQDSMLVVELNDLEGNEEAIIGVLNQEISPPSLFLRFSVPTT